MGLTIPLDKQKGIVGAVWPDEWMPVDEYGNRADVMVDMNTPVGRNNPGQLAETGINYIGEAVRRRAQHVQITSGTEEAFRTCMDWYNDINPNYAKIIDEGNPSAFDRKLHVKEAIEDFPRVWVPPYLDTLSPKKDDKWNILRNLKSYQLKWGAIPTPVTYKVPQPDGTVREFRTKVPFVIASKYYIHLSKIPEIKAPGPSSVSNIGIPTKSSHDSKHFPVSISPYRYGEDELRVMGMDSDPRESVRLQNLFANSPLGIRTAIATQLFSPKPSSLYRIPISNGKLLSTSAVLRLFHSTNATLGIESKRTWIDPFDVPEELADAIASEDYTEKEDVAPAMRKRNSSARSVKKQATIKKMLGIDDEMLIEDSFIGEDGLPDTVEDSNEESSILEDDE